MVKSLPRPAIYFPLEKGLYEVAPGLFPFGKDFGNQDLDRKIFQLDSDFKKYRTNKLACRTENLAKYYLESKHPKELQKAVAEFMIQRLLLEHSEHFEQRATPKGFELRCGLTQEVIQFDSDFNLLLSDPTPSLRSASAKYTSAMDALCSQVQEDVAVMRKSQTDSTSLKFDDWLSAIHLCSPGHWAAEDKIGKNFISIHTPVPGLEKINQNASKLVDAMIHKGPFVRFVWGFGSDNRLNHHPNPSPGVSEIEWRGRKFDQETSEKMGTCPFYLRVERQITWGLPALNAAIFTIRISFIDGNQIKFHPEQNRQLKTALASMTPEGRVYKGVETQTSEILDWLES